MKREKRHGIERELSIKRIRSQKKYSILIVSVLLLTCTLIQIGFQMSEGLKAAYIENRKAVYGAVSYTHLDVYKRQLPKKAAKKQSKLTHMQS